MWRALKDAEPVQAVACLRAVSSPGDDRRRVEDYLQGWITFAEFMFEYYLRCRRAWC